MYTGSEVTSDSVLIRIASRQLRAGNGSPSSEARAAKPPRAADSSTNGRKAIDFVSEDDVRRAIQKGEKIYVNARTIITPAARDMGEPAEVFAKVS